MAKRSTTQVSVTVAGDGINATYAPTPTINATAAPSGGPEQHTLVAATPRLFTPPTTTTLGAIIYPMMTDGILSDAAGLGSIPLAINTATFLSLLAPSAGFTLTSAGGGDVFIQWV